MLVATVQAKIAELEAENARLRALIGNPTQLAEAQKLARDWKPKLIAL